MNYFFAPMEGIAGYLYRNAHFDFFPGADAYYAPFITTTTSERLSTKEMRDLYPENNRVKLIPQIMAREASAFLDTARRVRDMGYEEINLNLGCPSRTVVSKGRGAGFLAEPENLERFFDGVFAQGIEYPLTVKTRIGMSNPEEFPRLMEIFRRYPIAVLIVHPRLQVDYYKGQVRLESFKIAMERATFPVVYNGDIGCVEDLEFVKGLFPGISGAMIGRGVLRNPAIFREIRGGKKLTKDDLFTFHQRLLRDDMGYYSGERPVVMKMKEVWTHMIENFAGSAKYKKRVLKANSISDLERAVDELLRECELEQEPYRLIDRDWEGKL